MKEVYDFLKKCGVFYIATVDKDQPHVRPFGGLNIFDDKLYIHTNKNKKVAHQLENNPKMEIVGFNKGSWIRVTGKAIRDDRDEAKKSMLDNSLPQVKKMYENKSDDSEVLYLSDVTATIYTPNSDPKTIKF